MKKFSLRIVTCGISGGRSLTRFVSRRPPIPLPRIVARAEDYTYDLKL
jgi:hypothetical protein